MDFGRRQWEHHNRDLLASINKTHIPTERVVLVNDIKDPEVLKTLPFLHFTMASMQKSGEPRRFNVVMPSIVEVARAIRPTLGVGYVPKTSADTSSGKRKAPSAHDELPLVGFVTQGATQNIASWRYDHAGKRPVEVLKARTACKTIGGRKEQARLLNQLKSDAAQPYPSLNKVDVGNSAFLSLLTEQHQLNPTVINVSRKMAAEMESVILPKLKEMGVLDRLTDVQVWSDVIDELEKFGKGDLVGGGFGHKNAEFFIKNNFSFTPGMYAFI